MNELNESVIVEFRANGGVVAEAMGGHFKNSTLALVHHVGRRTGAERVTPVLYMVDGEAFALVGSNGGAVQEPAWVANLAEMPETVVEIGSRTLRVRPVILRDGPDYERLYKELVAYIPNLDTFGTRTDREFPVVTLVPLD